MVPQPLGSDPSRRQSPWRACPPPPLSRWAGGTHRGELHAVSYFFGRGNRTTLDRWTVDLTTGKVREARLDDRPQEFPRIDERLLGRPHRFGYILLDAATLDTIAAVHLPDRVPHGFHGNWAPSAA
ncbi:MAG: carotenoid oxygenase family protein [Pseudonocardiaceae bacterium]